MKVLLLKDVYKLGRAGDVKKVANGYGRNYLIPQGLATLATSGALKMADRIRTEADTERAILNEEMSGIAEILDGHQMKFAIRASETGKLYGSVTTRMIAAEIKETLGVELGHRQVESQPIRNLGEVSVPIRLTIDLAPEIKVSVFREGEATEEVPAGEVGTEEAAQEPEELTDGAGDPDGEADVPEAEVEEEVPESSVEEAAEEEVPESSVEEAAEEEVPESSVEEAVEEEVPKSSVEEAVEEEVPESSVEEAAEEEVPESSVEEVAEEEVPESSVEEAVEEEVPESSVEEAAEEEVPESSVEEAAEEEVPESSVEEAAEEEVPDSSGEEAAEEAAPAPEVEADDAGDEEEEV